MMSPCHISVQSCAGRARTPISLALPRRVDLSRLAWACARFRYGSTSFSESYEEDLIM